jgi:hypothetical protein
VNAFGTFGVLNCWLCVRPHHPPPVHSLFKRLPKRYPRNTAAPTLPVSSIHFGRRHLFLVYSSTKVHTASRSSACLLSHNPSPWLWSWLWSRPPRHCFLSWSPRSVNTTSAFASLRSVAILIHKAPALSCKALSPAAAAPAASASTSARQALALLFCQHFDDIPYTASYFGILRHFGIHPPHSSSHRTHVCMTAPYQSPPSRSPNPSLPIIHPPLPTS